VRRMLRAAAAAVVAAVGAALVLSTPAGALPRLPDTSQEYWFVSWDIANVWSWGARGQGVIVAVLDSGVQASRPELAGVVLPGTDLVGGDGRTDIDSPRGHGTAMAYLIAGQGGVNRLVGIAPEAKLLPVTLYAPGAPRFDRAVADGIRYAVDHGAKVISIAQEAPIRDFENGCPRQALDAVRYAVDNGAVIVSAAGNEGNTTNEPLFPSSCPGVVVVGAVNGTKHIWPKSQRQPYVDVAALGVQMHSQNLAGQVGTSNGTSDAAALVSGAVALVWSKLPRLTNRQVVARLLATVTDDADLPGKDNATGYGIVRPDDAIKTNVPANAPNPIFDELDRLHPTSATPAAPAPTAAPSTPEGGGTGGPSGTASAGDKGTSLPVLVGAGLGAVAAVAGLVAFVTTRRRRAPAGPPPDGSTWPPMGPPGGPSGWPPR